jgi:hypothetical protein
MRGGRGGEGTTASPLARPLPDPLARTPPFPPPLPPSHAGPHQPRGGHEADPCGTGMQQARFQGSGSGTGFRGRSSSPPTLQGGKGIKEQHCSLIFTYYILLGNNELFGSHCFGDETTDRLANSNFGLIWAEFRNWH